MNVLSIFRSSPLRVCYLLIDGMTCDSCVFTITTKVSKKPGIKSIHVDLSSKVASIIYDSRVTATDFVIDHVHSLNEGFTASLAHHVHVLHVQGLNCGRCVAKIESSIDNVKVSLPQGKVFCMAPDTKLDVLKKSIDNLGFKTYPYGPHQGRVVLSVSMNDLSAAD